MIQSKKISYIVVLSLLLSIVLQDFSYDKMKAYAESPDRYSTLKLDGFENIKNWLADEGVTADLASDVKTEGVSSLRLSYSKQSSDQWMDFQTNLNPTLDLSTAWGFTLDVFPTTQTQGNEEPLVVKVIDNSGEIVYERPLEKLTSNQWNTVFIDLRDTGKHGDPSKIYNVNFYVYRDDSAWGNRSDVTYYLDNMAMVLPSPPVITADHDAGLIAKGAQVALATSVAGGEIYYTTDGSNPATSPNKIQYTQPIVIADDMTVTAYVSGGESSDRFLHIFRYIASDPIGMTVSTDKAGNIFTTADKGNFTIGLAELTGQNEHLSLAYTVKDHDGFTVYSDRQENVQLAASADLNIQKTIPIEKNGVYQLTVNVSNAEKSINVTKSISFSKVLPLLDNRSDSMSGVMTHFAHGKGDLDLTLPIAALGGAGFIRDEMYWDQAEQTKGVITIDPVWDHYVDAAIANGISPLLELTFGNELYDGGGIPVSDEGIAAFTKYATTLANHFKGKIKYFEIWNEPDSPAGTGFNPTGKTATDYANLVKKVYPAIKAVNPDAVVMIGSTIQVDIPWLTEMFQAGAYNYMDALSVHPYSWPLGPEAGNLVPKINATVDLMKQYGEGQYKPIWFTEIGWPTHTGPTGISDMTNAAYLARTYVLALSTEVVEKIMWYDLQDDGTDAQDSESRFGMIRAQHDPDSPYSAKPNYVAFNALNHELLGAKFVNKSNPDANINLYKFHRDSDHKDVLVAWNLFSAKTVGLNVGDGTFAVKDLFGNSKSYTAVNGVITVTVSDMPIYIEGAIEKYSLTSPTFNPAKSTVNAVGGSSFKWVINRAQAASSLAGHIHVALPDGWTLASGSDFSAGTSPIELTIDVPEGTEKKAYDIRIVLDSTDGQTVFADMAIKVNVTDPVLVSMSPSPILPLADGKWALKIELANISDASFSGKVTVLEPKTGWDADLSPAAFAEIAPGDSKTVVIPLGRPDQKLYDIKIGVQLSNGYDTEISRKTSFLAAAPAREPMKPDGIIAADEWDNSMQFKLDSRDMYTNLTEDWGGTEDLSGIGYVKWDASNLYLAVAVKDDKHAQSFKDGDIWQDDSIQFAFDPYRGSGQSSSGNNHEIGLALSGHGCINWRWTATAGKQSGSIPDLVCSIGRDEKTKTTSYEAAIPWNQLLPDGTAPKANDLFGFSLLINDNDGNGRKGFIEYMSGIGGNKNPSLYGDLILASTASDDGSTGENNGGENSNGSNGANGGGAGNPTPDAVIRKDGNSVTIVANAVVDPTSRTASVLLGKAIINDAFTQADADQKGRKKLTLSIPKVEGAAAYAVALPASVLSSGDAKHLIKVATELGTATVPTNMLAADQIPGDKDVSLVISRADSTLEDAAAKEKIGKRPVVDLSLKVDGVKRPWRNPDIQVEVSIPYTPTADELNDPEHIVVWYIDDSGKAEPAPSGRYDAASGQAVFTTTQFGRYAIAYSQKTFGDIQSYGWAKKAIEVMAAKGVIKGTAQDSFEPSKPIKRADFVTLLVKALALNAKTDKNFSDVDPNAYYAEPVAVAMHLGILNGVGDNKFNPESPITRQEMMTLIARAVIAANKELEVGATADLDRYADRARVAAYAEQSVSALVRSGIVTGDGFNINPLGNATRAETAVLLYKIYNY